MGNTSNFWQLWAPYLSYLEDNHLDIKTINALMWTITEPVLVVGGGQGLLVNELRKNGLQVFGVDSCPEMVKSAEERRGIKLVQTDGENLPFADECFETSIIATGVVDFMDEDEDICSLVEETIRVTNKRGRLLISFYKVNPVMENFLKRIGIITDKRIIRRKRVFELSRLSLGDFVYAIRKEGGLSLVSAVSEIIKLQLFLPKKERILSKNLNKILKSADNADELIESVSESIPYHSQESIRALFRKLGFQINEVMDFDGCFVVDVAP